MRVSVVTPTRNRPISFSLLERWVRLQTVQPDQWIVVNDGSVPYNYRMGQTVINREPVGSSLAENLLAALSRLQGDAVLIMEDDDWYARDFIEQHCKALEEGAKLVGCKPSRHYNLLTRRFNVFELKHCNLGSTGVHGSAIGSLEAIARKCAKANSFRVDVGLWALAGDKVKVRENPKNGSQHVGLKCMPGEPGLGMGHKLNYGIADESDMPTLRQWIGRADWEAYRQVAHGLYNVDAGS